VYTRKRTAATKIRIKTVNITSTVDIALTSLYNVGGAVGTAKRS
jgi:hypothetical protein